MKPTKSTPRGQWRSGVREHESLPAMISHLCEVTNRSNQDVATGIGCSETSVRNWLKGKTTPKAADLARLATLFGTTLMVTGA